MPSRAVRTRLCGMHRRALLPALSIAVVTSLAAQRAAPTDVSRLWTDSALKTWALPIAGVNAAPKFYTEAEYYAAPIDEVRTYPVYLKSREPAGYRDWMRKQGPQPLIEPAKLKSEADWIAAGQEVFDGLHLAEFRTADPGAFRWADDPDLVAHEGVTVAADGTIPGVRWLIDHDRQLKITLAECSACHTRILPDGSSVRGAQRNLKWGSLPQFSFAAVDEIRRREGQTRPPHEIAYSNYGVPWLKDDINATLRTMTAEQVGRVTGPPFLGTVARFNASPWFTTKIPDLIGVKDRRYLDATATHRNRGPEDIARYGILVAVAEDGAIGSYTFLPAENRALRYRYSDEAMLALGKYIYALQPPPNPNRPNAVTARGEQVFARNGCASCHTPPLYTNNRLLPVNGFTPFEHPSSPPAADVMQVAIGLDPGLALKTRKGTGYYKVPSLRGVWYRGPLEHSGSIASLEEWFDPARLRDDYLPKGWNPPDTRARAIPGHQYGLNLSAEDKRALIAFLRTL
jgi:mono/diheme cytochrome c family protein